jgi:uncharacterized protein YjlB
MTMTFTDTIRRTVRRVTGIGQPGGKELKARVRQRKAWTYRLQDDGLVPNHPAFPLICYRNAADLSDTRDPAAIFEQLFADNDWAGSWRDGIYDYVHYHPRTHEVLGIAKGRARVQFGGPDGKILSLKAGDVVVLPAGTGHQALFASRDLLVVGAYPPEGKYDEYEGSLSEHDRAVEMIAKVRKPAKDPVYGAKGPLKTLWRRSAASRAH